MVPIPTTFTRNNDSHGTAPSTPVSIPRNISSYTDNYSMNDVSGKISSLNGSLGGSLSGSLSGSLTERLGGLSAGVTGTNHGNLGDSPGSTKTNLIPHSFNASSYSAGISSGLNAAFNSNLSPGVSEKDIEYKSPGLNNVRFRNSTTDLLHMRTQSASSQNSFPFMPSVSNPNSSFTYSGKYNRYYSLREFNIPIQIGITMLFPKPSTTSAEDLHSPLYSRNSFRNDTNSKVEISNAMYNTEGHDSEGLISSATRFGSDNGESEKKAEQLSMHTTHPNHQDFISEETDNIKTVQSLNVQFFSIKADIPVPSTYHEVIELKSAFDISKDESSVDQHILSLPIMYKDLIVYPHICNTIRKDIYTDINELSTPSDDDSSDIITSKSDFVMKNTPQIPSAIDRRPFNVNDQAKYFQDGNIRISIRFQQDAVEKHFKVALFEGNELRQGTFLLDCETGVLEKDLECQFQNEIRSQPLEWLDHNTLKTINSVESKLKQNRYILRIEFPQWKYPVIRDPEVQAKPRIQSHANTSLRVNTKKKRMSIMPNIDVMKYRLNSPPANGSVQTSISPIPPSRSFFQNSRTSRSISDASRPQSALSSSISNNVHMKIFEEFEQELFIIQDFAEVTSNPTEDKHMQMSLNLTGDYRNLKPNTEESKRLREIIELSPLQEMKMDQKELLWKFRYYLLTNKHALIKFLRIIDWENERQVQEATSLLEEWAEMPSLDAIELLSSHFKDISLLRSYAIRILTKADSETLSDILLELVQSLRYESDMINSDLAALLLKRAESNFEICNKLNWYLHVEVKSDRNPKSREQYEKIARHLWIHLRKTKNEKCEKFVEKLARQSIFLQDLDQLGMTIKASKGDRPRKIQKLKRLLQDEKNWGKEKFFSNISSKLPPSYLTLPLNPSIQVSGVYGEKCTIFKSAKNPILLPFYTVDNEESDSEDEVEQREDVNQNKTKVPSIYSVIYKSGDDLRQDQLVIQMISLMDKLLKRNGLDLKLIPYKVLATSSDSGFVECISPNKALSEVISDSKGDIAKWIRSQNKADDVEEAFNSFIRSCAGYSVITYILGVGDRHLDNILLRPNGQLFHIDFGFILGRDPKPFPPPIRLCKEMVTGMKNMPGDTENENGFQKYIQLCCTSYNIIRRYSKLILNMFLLMSDANIPDLSYGNDPIRNIMKVEEKLNPFMSDAEASQFMKSVIHESERAIVAQITEKIHIIAQYVRS